MDLEKKSINLHSRLVNDALIALSETGECRVWKHHTGTAVLENGQTIRFGLLGSSDIIGIHVSGRFLCFEAKTGNAVQSKQQKNFEKMINLHNGFYMVFHSPVEAVRGLLSI